MTPSEIAGSLGLSLSDGRFSSSGDEISFCCPFCTKIGKTPDRRYKLYLHVGEDKRQGLFQCFRCGKRGKAGDRAVEQKPIRSIVMPVFQVDEPIKLPIECEELDVRMKAYEYLIERGIDDLDMSYYNMKIWKGRILFPDYVDDTLIYWVARTYTNQVPKYYNCPKVKRSDKLYNYGRFLKEDFSSITITEGPISAIVAGRDAIATYGKLVTQRQIDLLSTISVDTVYIALDPDAKNEAVELAKKLSLSFNDIRLVNMLGKEDPASLGRKEFNKRKEEAIYFNVYDKNSIFRYLTAA